MAVTLTGKDGDVFTFDEGEVEDVVADITASYEQYGQYTGGPSESYVYESDGPTKVISVSGVLYETATSRTDVGTTKTIDEQRQWLEKQFSGGQSPQNFSSNYAGTTYSSLSDSFVQTTVIKGKITFRESSGNVDTVQFNMFLLVGGQ